ncbi:MAG TPA: glycosyltransferase [Thermoanaerobaculia bacterium]
MKIGILGTRGVPPRYGGFETFVAELGTRLVRRGHDVTIYCRAQSAEGRGQEIWNGIRRVVVPAIHSKYFETVSHTLLSAIDAMRRSFDVALMCNAANAFTIPLLRAAHVPVAINVDGIERRRREWNIAGRAVYLAGEALAATFANRVVADADVIAEYYRTQFGIEPETIPYGANFPAEPDSDVLARLGLGPRNYLLYVSRFEPENNPLEVVEAYEHLRSAIRDLRSPLVMVGDALYDKPLLKQLHTHRSESILFPGALYGADYRTLQRNALIYIQATEVGGTHPALIEAMASGGCVLAHDTPENREVGGDAVGYFRFRPEETLSESVRLLLASPETADRMRRKARERVAARYDWEAVTDAYERLFREISGTS